MGPQTGEIERVAPDQEEARERIADRAQPEGKCDSCERDERARDERPRCTQPRDRGAAAEAGRDDQVALGLLRLLPKRRDAGGGMLEVGVHDAHPGRTGGRDARHNCSSKSSLTLTRGTMDDRDVEPCRGPPLGDDRRGSVVGVVHDDEFGVDAREFAVQAVDERADDGFLVARGRDDRQLRRPRPPSRSRAGGRRGPNGILLSLSHGSPR